MVSSRLVTLTLVVASHLVSLTLHGRGWQRVRQGEVWQRGGSGGSALNTQEIRMKVGVTYSVTFTLNEQVWKSV